MADGHKYLKGLASGYRKGIVNCLCDAESEMECGLNEYGMRDRHPVYSH